MLKGRVAGCTLPRLGDPLALCLYYFQIFSVDPDDAVEKRMLAVERFRTNLKNVAIDFVDGFGTEIGENVFGGLRSGKGKSGHWKELMNTVGFELKIRLCGRGRVRLPFVKLAVFS